jgi:hypothetical protein
MSLSPRIDLALRDEVHRDLAIISDAVVVGFDELMAWLGENEAGLRSFIVDGIIKPTDAGGGKFLLKQSIEA